MIIIKKNSVEVDKNQIKYFQKEFKTKHSFIIPSFFCDSLQPFITNYLNKATYSINTHTTNSGKKLIGKEYMIPVEHTSTLLLNFYLNNDKVINTIKEITQLNDIKSFNGRIYKFESDENSFDSWHSDLERNGKQRLVGISLNLSPQPYEGGIFSLRHYKTHEVFTTVQHKNWGGVHFFKIHPDLEHMVSSVKGNYPRIAFAGWFLNTKLSFKK